ncbi:hypothetical protein [Marinobacter zhanjiangensis]|uniref:Thioesterase domain-containing protein n=1 Tax=Marinobacter zhanjiangensis TaxID=578215 RepID=A0ABQ3AN87_9GAMM|nr:hypothetical protein [Marinobacter zhanjiangensis]GGY61342.1 hypothetical protein GCM10007071_05200 [Marinobacter zhanjiangensis]
MANGLTVFLGGAGMNGSYQEDMITSLRQAGISNPAYGNYSGLFKGVDEHLPSSLDTLGDASAVVFYNQDKNDPIALQLVNTNQCKVEGKYSALGLVVHEYSGRNSLGEECARYVLRYELSTPRDVNFSLQTIGINNQRPQRGQFNFIGYSWGAVIAARTALYYANLQVEVDHLVLVGAPINLSLLRAVRTHAHIRNVIVIDLKQHGDPIYAGMSDAELITSVPILASQMRSGSGEGHFYYAVENGDGQTRRHLLARSLFQKGLR